MPAIGNIALQDAATTPVTHTFNPSSVKGDVASYANQAPLLPIGYELIGATLTDPAGKSTVYRVNVRLRMPVLKTTTDTGGNSTTTVDYFTDVSCDFLLPQRSTLQNRKDVRKMFASLLADPQIVGMVENLQHIY